MNTTPQLDLYKFAKALKDAADDNSKRYKATDNVYHAAVATAINLVIIALDKSIVNDKR